MKEYIENYWKYWKKNYAKKNYFTAWEDYLVSTWFKFAFGCKFTSLFS